MTLHMLAVLGVTLLMWVMAWNLRSVKLRQTVLLLASYFFYSSWGIGFLAILIASSLVNFMAGSLLRRRLSIGYLWLGIAVNVALLGFFKYLPPILSKSGAVWQPELVPHIVMPVGMSFWTFQGLSYLIDVYLEEDIDPSLTEFCLYMAFWPTVLSGPVCRLPAMLPQFRRQPVFSWNDISEGARLVMQGVFMKMYLAQLVASGWTPGEGVAAGFDRMTNGWGGVDVWLLGIGLGFQLFFDFAGYSLMVIGAARLFGIKLPENFNRPFLSATPAIFWTRWHMSLSFWIRDYVFRPLATLRRERWWSFVVLVISMTLFGLWHGAKWTFIIFGVYHGLLLVLHRLGQMVKSRLPVSLPHGVGSALSWGTTFLLVALGYVLFRAKDLTQASLMVRSVLSPEAYRHLALPHSFYIFILTVAGGYFVYAVGSSLILSLMVRYRQTISGGERSLDDRRRAALPNAPLVAGALVDFLAVNLWWWLGPAVVSIAAFVGLALYTQRAAIPVTPFIYTLF